MRAWLLSVALPLAACGQAEVEALDFGPTGPPALRIASPALVDGQPPCLVVEDDADARVSVLADVDELLLRPPGVCGIAAQCGRLVLYADGVLNNESAVPAIDLLLRRLGDRYHDGFPDESGQRDVLRLTLEVVNDADDTLLDHAGAPLVASIDVAIADRYGCRRR